MARVLNKLTDTTFRNAKAKERPYKLFDGGGLHLLVNPNGSKYWRLKYRINKKEKTFAIGVYPSVSLAEARKQRDEARNQLEGGIDPSLAKKDAKRQAQFSNTNTFESVAREWHEQLQHKWTPDHSSRVMRSLELNAFPTLGSRPISEISSLEVLDTINEITNRGALEIAQRVLQRCSAVFVYAITLGKLKNNPANGLQAYVKKIPKNERRHYASLTPDELPEFLGKLSSYDGEPLTKLAVQLLLLTFVRPGELRWARWNEFDFEKRLWRIPASRMKSNKDHLIPLSTQALEVLSQIHDISGQFELLFPGRSSVIKPFSENTILYALYRMGYYKRMTAHGFRSTASTFLNENGYNTDAIERQLAHGEPNKVRDAYNRADYMGERLKMMQNWGNYVEELTYR